MWKDDLKLNLFETQLLNYDKDESKFNWKINY